MVIRYHGMSIIFSESLFLIDLWQNIVLNWEFIFNLDLTVSHIYHDFNHNHNHHQKNDLRPITTNELFSAIIMIIKTITWLLQKIPPPHYITSVLIQLQSSANGGQLNLLNM